MKKDIPIHKVKNLAVAMVPGATESDLWDCYLLNFHEQPIKSVLICSRGYEDPESGSRKTSVMRHFFEKIEGLGAHLIEPVQKDVFDMTNEYWVSFVMGDYMYDKKYIFVKGSISEEYFTPIPFLHCSGVMIR